MRQAWVSRDLLWRVERKVYLFLLPFIPHVSVLRVGLLLCKILMSVREAVLPPITDHIG